MYTLAWKNPALKGPGISVPVASAVSNKASLTFTGKGYANYGQIQQQNLLRLLENFADNVEPLNPTVGQQWYDTTSNVLKICISTENGAKWRSLGGVQATPVNSPPPSPAAVGDVWVQSTGTSSGNMLMYDGFGRYGGTDTTIGGWNQVWPAVEVVAGREEYDIVLGMVNQLIGPTPFGGSGALGALTPPLAPLTQLDASLQNKFALMPTRDPNILTPVTDPASELTVDVTSNDWDLLLAAAKFAVNRLDLPAGMADDISPMPFVYDGLQAPAALTSLPATNVMYPSLERRSNRHFGIVTMIRAYSETLNVLQAAVANRYTLKGMNGATGANPNFGPGVTTTRQANWSGTAGGANAGDVTLRLRFNSPAELDTFLNSGAAIQIIATNTVGSNPTTGDTNLKTLFDSRGIVRITADKVRVFANTFPPTMSSQPSQIGISGSTTTSSIITTQSVSNAMYEVGVAIASTHLYIEIRFHFVSSGAMNGAVTVGFDVIRDTATYVSGTQTLNAYGAPLPFNSADKFSTTPWLT